MTLRENFDYYCNMEMIELTLLGNNGDRNELRELITAHVHHTNSAVGHCGAGQLLDLAGTAARKRFAVHPMVRAMVQRPVATDAPYEIDANFYTTQEEHTLPAMIGKVVKALV